MVQENPTEFTPMQLQYIHFLASGKLDKNGKKWTREQFARNVAKVDPTTLYDWQRLPGFKERLLKETMSRLAEWIPAMTQAQIAKAVKGDTPAYKVMLNQWSLLAAEKIEQRNENYNIDSSLSE